MSLHDFKKKKEDPCCVFVLPAIASTATTIEEKLVDGLFVIDARGLSDEDNRQALLGDAMNKLGEQARGAYQKLLEAKCNLECCEKAADAIRDTTEAYACAIAGTGGGDVPANQGKVLQSGLDAGSPVNSSELGMEVNRELAAHQAFMDLIVSALECPKKCPPKEKFFFKKHFHDVSCSKKKSSDSLSCTCEKKQKKKSRRRHYYY